MVQYLCKYARRRLGNEREFHLAIFIKVVWLGNSLDSFVICFCSLFWT